MRVRSVCHVDAPSACPGRPVLKKPHPNRGIIVFSVSTSKRKARKSSEDDVVVEPSQTKAPEETNLIDLDDGDIGQAYLSFVD